MNIIGTIESLWRYPVKSMAGKDCPSLFLGFAGVFGDRLYAVRNAAAPAVFPYLTAREKPAMVRYAPRFRDEARAAAPPLIADLEKLGIGVTPIYPRDDALALDVSAPGGSTLDIDDPALLADLAAGMAKADLSLIRSDRALTDCRPISFMALQTIAALGAEMGQALDKRRFRMNLYADMPGLAGFGEEGLIGKRLKIGARAEIALTERDGRCAMIGICPDTAARDGSIPRQVVSAHGGAMGVYGAVVTEGVVRAGDEIAVIG